MATILMNAVHSANDISASAGIHNIISGIERILKTRHNVLSVPSNYAWTDHEIDTWLRNHAWQADLYLGSDTRVIKLLRTGHWPGHILLNILGDLPRGAATLRNALPYLHSTDTIWCASTSDKQIYELLVQQDGCQPGVALLPYGIDCDEFPCLDTLSRERIRQAWGLTPDHFVVVYAGRITLEKNFHTLLEALYYARKSGLLCQLIVAGNIYDLASFGLPLKKIALAARIETLLKELSLTDCIRRIPWMEHTQLSELYTIGDVFVNLTLHHDEQFGYSQVEAMSAGLPVIGTAWGGLKDTILDGKTGFLIDTWVSHYGVRLDIYAVIQALQYFADKCSPLQDFRSRAAQHARQYYAWPVYSSRVLDAIEQILSQQKKGQQAHYTAFGASFHKRFSFCNAFTEDALAVYPRYKTLPDADYTALIAPYTSSGLQETFTGKNVFSALPGKIEGAYFLSQDPLWSTNILLEQQEVLTMRQLIRYPALARDALACPDEVLHALLRKGLIGASCWQQSIEYVPARNR